MFSSAGSSSCTSCVPGYYGSKGSPCLECASGSYSAVEGSSICLSCPTGLYIV
jgi:syndecan 4